LIHDIIFCHHSPIHVILLSFLRVVINGRVILVNYNQINQTKKMNLSKIFFSSFKYWMLRSTTRAVRLEFLSLCTKYYLT
jgi:hypothetical protein